MTIYIYGAGGLGREVLAVLKAARVEVAGFIVDAGFPTADIHGTPVRATGLAAATDPHAHFVLAVGDGRARKLAADALGPGTSFASAVHAGAILGPCISTGVGLMIVGPASLTTDIALGDHVLINPGCTIAHDCVLGSFVNLSPSVALAGRVRVEEGANLGVGVSVKPGVVIGAWSTVGAGAAVVGDVEPGSTVVGVPARPIRRKTPSS